MYDKKTSGALIQSKRLEARLTQEQLAEKVGCSARHIVNVERGAVGLSIESMLKLCSIFQITPNDLLLPAEDQDCSGLNWVTASLKAMRPEQRKTAISIVSPYIETVLLEES